MRSQNVPGCYKFRNEAPRAAKGLTPPDSSGAVHSHAIGDRGVRDYGDDRVLQDALGQCRIEANVDGHTVPPGRGHEWSAPAAVRQRRRVQRRLINDEPEPVRRTAKLGIDEEADGKTRTELHRNSGTAERPRTRRCNAGDRAAATN